MPKSETNPKSAGSSAEELAWFEQLAARDQGALAAIYDRYGRVVYSLASRMLSDPREIEEVTQDVFLSIWRSPSAYRPQLSSPLTWLAALTRNKCIDRLRKSGRRIPAPPDDPESAAVFTDESRSSNPFLMAALQDLSRQVRDCLGRLSGDQRKAVELAYFECLTHSEIAERLAEPSGTVKSRLRLAMGKLRLCLGGSGA